MPDGCVLDLTSGGGDNANSITLGLEIDEDLIELDHYGDYTISVGIKDPSTGYLDTTLVEFDFVVVLTEFSPLEEVTFEQVVIPRGHIETLTLPPVVPNDSISNVINTVMEESFSSVTMTVDDLGATFEIDTSALGTEDQGVYELTVKYMMQPGSPPYPGEVEQKVYEREMIEIVVTDFIREEELVSEILVI